jgi:hypothetical protein
MAYYYWDICNLITGITELLQRELYSSVFVFSLRAAFDCVFNLKTLKVHNMFRSLRPSLKVHNMFRSQRLSYTACDRMQKYNKI